MEPGTPRCRGGSSPRPCGLSQGGAHSDAHKLPRRASPTTVNVADALRHAVLSLVAQRSALHQGGEPPGDDEVEGERPAFDVFAWAPFVVYLQYGSDTFAIPHQ